MDLPCNHAVRTYFNTMKAFVLVLVALLGLVSAFGTSFYCLYLIFVANQPHSFLAQFAFLTTLAAVPAVSRVASRLQLSMSKKVPKKVRFVMSA